MYYLLDKSSISRCYINSIIADNVSLISKGALPDTFKLLQKFRYRQQDNKVTVRDWRIPKLRHFPRTDTCHNAWTSSCFYQGEECQGGGTINQVYRNSKQLTYIG